MPRHALLSAACWMMISGFGSWMFAEEASPGTASVFTPPPAPTSTEPGGSFNDVSGKTTGTSPEEVFASEAAGNRLPSEAEKSDSEAIIVPAPVESSAPKPTPTEPEPVEQGITIRIGPDDSEEPWCELNDFAYSRWRPFSQTKWMPGHRDRFGMFSLVGDGGVSAWDDWGGLASTHGWGVHFLNGPVRTDLPSKVFDFTWGLHWNGEITSGWSASLSAKVGLFTDFEDSVRDGWRVPAHAVVFHDWNESLQGVAGVKYLDRENLPLLPVLGVILRPDDGFRLEAVFPEPRAAIMVTDGEDTDNWLTFSGEIGGGEWAIERSNTDLADVVTYNDYSAVLGFHIHSPNAGTDRGFEIGYTFARDLEYRSGVGDFEPEDTFFVRWSSHY